MRSSGDSSDDRMTAMLQRWADGKASLKDVRGYTDEELYAVAKTAYFLYCQGRLAQARTLYQGLYAISPTNPYFANALAVVELASGNTEGALAAYDVAAKLAPNDPAAYVGRAEVKLVMGHRSAAREDLRRALEVSSEDEPLHAKARALLESLRENNVY